MSASAEQIDGVVLAGGNSSRMQAGEAATDKAWLTLNGLALIERASQRLVPQVATLYISTHHDIERYAALGTTLRDATDDRQGPLAGVFAAMGASAASWLAVAPCDCPSLPEGWVARLYQAARDAQALSAVVTQNGLRQPVCMIVRCDLQANLQAALASGIRKVGQWQREVGAITVAFDDAPAHAFMNINTPEDLLLAQQILGVESGPRLSGADGALHHQLPPER